MKKWILISCLFFLSSPLLSAPTVGTSVFQQGNKKINLTGGMGRAFQQDYLILGLGAAYYIANGLELGLDAEGWLGNSPNIYKLSPQVRYVVHQIPRIHPFVGAFYRRTFYEGLSDLDSYGSRVGAYAPMGPNAFFGLGYVFETYAGCDDRIYSSCSTEYPELTFMVGF